MPDLPEIEAKLLDTAKAADASLKAAVPLSHRDDVAERRDDEEPMFSIVGRDILGPQVVRYWADLAEKQGVDPAKVARARQCAADMLAWEGPKKLPD